MNKAERRWISDNRNCQHISITHKKDKHLNPNMHITLIRHTCANNALNQKNAQYTLKPGRV